MAQRRKIAGGVRDFRHTDAVRKDDSSKGLVPTLGVWVGQMAQYVYAPYYLNLRPQLVDRLERIFFECIPTKVTLEVVHKSEHVQPGRLIERYPSPCPKKLSLTSTGLVEPTILIFGALLPVTNSLLAKKGIMDKAQMIYVDLPYPRAGQVLSSKKVQ